MLAFALHGHSHLCSANSHEQSLLPFLYPRWQWQAQVHAEAAAGARGGPTGQ